MCDIFKDLKHNYEKYIGKVEKHLRDMKFVHS